MHGSSAEGVVNLKLEEQSASCVKDPSTNKTGKDASPRLNDIGAGSDADQANKGTIAEGQ